MGTNKPYYPNLEAEISKMGVKKQDIAFALCITPRTFSKKMMGEIDFWWREVLLIHDILPDVPIITLFEHKD